MCIRRPTVCLQLVFMPFSCQYFSWNSFHLGRVCATENPESCQVRKGSGKILPNIMWLMGGKMMNRSIRTSSGWVLVFGVVFTVSSISCSFTNTIEKSFDFTSSTTPSSWYFPGALQKQQKIVYFSKANFGRLKEDMASGHGKYLTSLATLMEVPKAHHQEFFVMTKDNFHNLFPTEQVTPEEMLLTLSKTLPASTISIDELALNKG